MGQGCSYLIAWINSTVFILKHDSLCSYWPWFPVHQWVIKQLAKITTNYEKPSSKVFSVQIWLLGWSFICGLVRLSSKTYSLAIWRSHSYNQVFYGFSSCTNCLVVAVHWGHSFPAVSPVSSTVLGSQKVFHGLLSKGWRMNICSRGCRQCSFWAEMEMKGEKGKEKKLVGGVSVNWESLIGFGGKCHVERILTSNMETSLLSAWSLLCSVTLGKGIRVAWASL